MRTNPASSFDATVRGAGSLAAAVGPYDCRHPEPAIGNAWARHDHRWTCSDFHADRHLRVEHLALTSGDSNLSVTGQYRCLKTAKPAAFSRHALFWIAFKLVSGDAYFECARCRAGECDPHRKWSALDPNGFDNNPGWRFQVAIDSTWHRESIRTLQHRGCDHPHEQISGTIGTGRFSIGDLYRFV